jgi:transposase
VGLKMDQKNNKNSQIWRECSMKNQLNLCKKNWQLVSHPKHKIDFSDVFATTTQDWIVKNVV